MLGSHASAASPAGRLARGSSAPSTAEATACWTASRIHSSRINSCARTFSHVFECRHARFLYTCEMLRSRGGLSATVAVGWS
eukprot:scaffold204945_cov33-Tisochrysis_lutea.AAC.1